MLDTESYMYLYISLSTILMLVRLTIIFLKDEILVNLMKLDFMELHPIDTLDH
jgi:hypothetical protein